MGGAVSAGDTNDELVDNLIEENFIRSDHVKEAFRAVDRGRYYLPQDRSTAYHDMAWKHQNLHLSAPCIYSEVMEHLDLKPGLSFLNLGSGTGYVNTMVGLILGPTGVNHGVEIHEDVVEYANEKLQDFIESSPSFDWFDFCPPQFVCGNGLKIPIDTPGYDRIYCGADCPVIQKNYMCNLLNINGVMVVPMDDHLDVIKRTGQSDWESSVVMSVSFASLLQPASEEPVQLPKRFLPTLYNLCRYRIRRAVREHCSEDIKEEKRKRRKKKKKTKLSDEDLGVNISRALNTDTVSSSDSEEHEDEEEDVDIEVNDETEIENVPSSSPTNGRNNHNTAECSSTKNGKKNNTSSHDADDAASRSENKMATSDDEMDAEEEVSYDEKESKEDTSNAQGDDSLKKVKPDNGDRTKNSKMEDDDNQMDNEEDELVGIDIPSSDSSDGSGRRGSDEDDEEEDNNNISGLQRFMQRRRLRMLQNPRYSSRTSAERGMMSILSSVLRRRRTPSKTLSSDNGRKRMKPVDGEVDDAIVDSMSDEEAEDVEILHLHIEDTSFTQSILTLPLPPIMKKYLLYNRVEID